MTEYAAVLTNGTTINLSPSDYEALKKFRGRRVETNMDLNGSVSIRTTDIMILGPKEDLALLLNIDLKKPDQSEIDLMIAKAMSPIQASYEAQLSDKDTQISKLRDAITSLGKPAPKAKAETDDLLAATKATVTPVKKDK